ncbi:MAG: L-seryl-tRNA(Sec) selenium transferase [candidate division Zixibacteria bacterium]|nr:L-seryl-tRNA(Sec) selenium transferase [candidate division Zixibacteria bacterium]
MQNPGEKLIKEKLRQLPSVEKILESEKLKDKIEKYSHPLVTEAARETLLSIREQIKENPHPAYGGIDQIIEKVSQTVDEKTSDFTRPVINATGVILHTNLGRAPLNEETLSHIAEISKNYNNLEFDLKAGKRSHRGLFLEKLLCQLTSAESALAVNNNAGAVLLILTALAKGKEVIVSRGELVQIGGGFRIPEILALSGAILKEVGTTNKTTLSDYENVITQNTALLLKVHQSNFRMIGFVDRPSISQLVELGEKHNLCVAEDLGSGVMLRTEDFELAHEPTALEAISAGADLVCFSGDKLLGAPQAGIILGRKKYIDLLRKHPLHRALRLDKMFIAGLESVLLSYLKGEATRKIPAWQMISTPLDVLKKRAENIKEQLKKSGISITLTESKSTVGGGSLPGETLPTIVISVPSVDTSTGMNHTVHTVDQQAQLFREQSPPIIGRIEDEKFVLDLRTIFPHQDELIIKAIKNIFPKRS